MSDINKFLHLEWTTEDEHGEANGQSTFYVIYVGFEVWNFVFYFSDKIWGMLECGVKTRIGILYATIHMSVLPSNHTTFSFSFSFNSPFYLHCFLLCSLFCFPFLCSVNFISLCVYLFCLSPSLSYLVSLLLFLSHSLFVFPMPCFSQSLTIHNISIRLVVQACA
jgi:hypothetical protein